MIDKNKIKTEIERARTSAVDLQKFAQAAEKAVERRDDALYDFFRKMYKVRHKVRELDLPRKHKVLGDGYRPFGPSSQIAGLLLKKIFPELDAKKRGKYAAVLNYVAERKPKGEKLRDFVRNNRGINGCVAKEKELRKEKQRSTKGKA